MLQSLIVRDMLLIRSLELDFHKNLTVLTGETGAGKSIVLDCLGLLLGERGSSSLVRSGAKHATLTATFTLSQALKKHLTAQDILVENELVIRRFLTEDGRSKAYINDELVGITLLKKVGESLVEIHGQFDHLLEATTHRSALDRYGELEKELQEVEKAYNDWKEAKQKHDQAQQDIETFTSNHAFLKQAVDELSILAPEEGEEEKLVEERSFLINKAKLTDALEKVLSLLTHEKGIESSNNLAFRTLERIIPYGLGKIEPILEILERIGNETQEAIQHLHSLQSKVEGEKDRLETLENRLYALRGMARKHTCPVASLPAVLSRYQQDLRTLDLSQDHLTSLHATLREEEKNYRNCAQDLSAKRREKARTLAHAVNQELKPLKLETAEFFVEVESSRDVKDFSSTGVDHIEFQVQTNPGTPKGALRKIASGGERARFMLALKVVLAEREKVPSLIFDEIDSGVGGAVASAIGERLKKLSEDSQIIVVTHCPQVAAFGDQHLKVQKESKADTTETIVTDLSFKQRREEIARMLAGKLITDEARAAADQLLDSRVA